MSLFSSCSCLCSSVWSQLLSREWRCSWSSANRRCSSYIWVTNNFIANQGASYIRYLTVINTGSGNTSVVSGNKPLPEQMLTKSMLQYGITRPQWVKMSFCLDGGNEIMPAWMCICTWWKLNVDVATETISTAHVKSLAKLSHSQI